MNIKNTNLYKSITTDDPELNAWLHKRLLFFWLLIIPIAIFTDLKKSIEFLVFISLLAIVEGEWGSYQQAKSEITIEKTVSDIENK